MKLYYCKCGEKYGTIQSANSCCIKKIKKDPVKRKKIICTVTGKEFKNMSEASKSVGMKYNTLVAMFLGRYKNTTSFIEI